MTTRVIFNTCKASHLLTLLHSLICFDQGQLPLNTTFDVCVLGVGGGGGGGRGQEDSPTDSVTLTVT